jgi:hypothetical protein
MGDALMREIGCPSCKYGRTEIVSSEVEGRLTRIKRKCITCGAELATYMYNDAVAPLGNTPPPTPSEMPDIVGPLRDDKGKLLWNPEGIEP